MAISSSIFQHLAYLQIFLEMLYSHKLKHRKFSKLIFKNSYNGFRTKIELLVDDNKTRYTDINEKKFKTLVYLIKKSWNIVNNGR